MLPKRSTPLVRSTAHVTAQLSREVTPVDVFLATRLRRKRFLANRTTELEFVVDVHLLNFR